MFIPYTDKNFIFTGIWQENGNEEIVNYKSASFFEIGFTGKTIEIKGTLQNLFEVYIDGQKVHPIPVGNQYNFAAESGEHLLKVCIRQENHLKLKGIEIGEDGTHPSLAGYADLGMKLTKYIRKDLNM